MRRSRGTRGGASVREALVPVRLPYRLDLTATVLRRLSTNVVDVFEDGVYRRLIGLPADPTVLTVAAASPDALRVTLRGPAADTVDPAAAAERILGTQRDVEPFVRAAERIPWLRTIARGARGVKPPRYPSLWESVVNAVVYQQVSIHAAGAILRRVIERYGRPTEDDGVRLLPFFAPETLLDADPVELRDLGLSANKVSSLKAVAAAIVAGDLDEATLDELATSDLLQALVAHRGIGPWTAAVVALRGFGRLDVFPLNDSGAERSLRELSGGAAVDVHRTIAALAPQQGMLYYHLLLARLAARGEVDVSAG